MLIPRCAAAPKPAAHYAATWKLKGVVGSGPQATAMVGVGHKTYTFGVGEKLKVDTGSGKVDVSMEEAGTMHVALNVDGEKVLLSLNK